MSETKTEARPVDEGVLLPPPTEEPKALATRPAMAIAERGVMLRSFEDLQRFSKMALESGAAPKGMATIGQVAVAIQAGMEAGLTPMHALQAIVVINGATSWRGQSAMGLIRADPRCQYVKAWTEGRGDDMKGVCVSRRKGGNEERTEFTVEQAKRAGLWNKRGRDGADTPWITYPDRMLMWRAVGFHCKEHWSDALGGFPIAEEAQDYPEDARPVRAPVTPPTSPDPLLADVIPVQAVPANVAPCCGGDHAPGETCSVQVAE